MKKLVILSIIGLMSTGLFAKNTNTINKKNCEKTIIINSEVKSNNVITYPKGWYDVQCGNGASFYGYWDGTGGIYSWAARVCDSIEN